MDGIDRDGFAALMRESSTGMTDDAIAEYWKGYAGETRRRAQLELYRSGDFSKLEGYDLAALDVPTLLLWGEDDAFAPVAGAHRFQRELPDTELVVVDGARHFVWEDAPEECAAALTGFLARVRG
jgi:pimeloyl-ACP methyl ester carboxylesterase